MLNPTKNLFNDYQELLIKNDKLANENSKLRYLHSLDEKTIETKKKLIEEQKNIIAEKDKQIQELLNKLGRAESKLNIDGSNSSIPTSQTPINKKKVIPNTREKTDKSKGGQLGHKKHKLEKFANDEVTEYVGHVMCNCPHCNSSAIEPNGQVIEKDELDFKIIVKKKRHQFIEYNCLNCNKTFHENIPNNLKEDNQYGLQVKTLVLTLSNQGNMTINKIKSVISGMTENHINLSEGYIAKLQVNAAKNLENFLSVLKNKIIDEKLVYWDDTVIMIDTNRACLRFYGTDKLALYKAHMHKNKEGLDEDNILVLLPKDTIVMHDHNKINYNGEYIFSNAECNRHLIKDLKSNSDNSSHKWSKELATLLTKMNHKRDNLIHKGIETFSDEELEKFNTKFDSIMLNAYKENENDDKAYFVKEELALINRILDYKENYLLWIYNFEVPFTNNLSERSLRGVKSKQKASGQFQNEKTAQNYAAIHSYVETCHRNNVNIYNALLMLSLGRPYNLEDILSGNI